MQNRLEGHAVFKIWIFRRATKIQLLGHFWPAGHGLHTLDLYCFCA